MLAPAESAELSSSSVGVDGVASILEKLDAAGRTDAVAHAVRLGLILL
jgi:hypothetical protein